MLKVLANNKGKRLLLLLMSAGYSNLEAERGAMRPLGIGVKLNVFRYCSVHSCRVNKAGYVLPAKQPDLLVSLAST